MPYFIRLPTFFSQDGLLCIIDTLRCEREREVICNIKATYVKMKDEIEIAEVDTIILASRET